MHSILGNTKLSVGEYMIIKQKVQETCKCMTVDKILKFKPHKVSVNALEEETGGGNSPAVRSPGAVLGYPAGYGAALPGHTSVAGASWAEPAPLCPHSPIQSTLSQLKVSFL